MFVKMLARQLRHPSGLMGKYVSRWMNRSNVAIYHTALDLVVTSSRGRLLEIGFGGGALLKMALACGAFPKVFGIDASLDMVKLVQRNLNTHVRQGFFAKLSPLPPRRISWGRGDKGGMG